MADRAGNAAPAALDAMAVGTTDQSVSWKAPDDQPGAPVTGYRVSTAMKSGDDWQTIVSATPALTRRDVRTADANLEASTEYSYRDVCHQQVGVYNSDTTETARVTVCRIGIAARLLTTGTATTVQRARLRRSPRRPMFDVDSPTRQQSGHRYLGRTAPARPD